MSKVYLVIVSSKIDRSSAIAHLQAKKLVTDWFYNLPNSFFVRSEESAKVISDAIIGHFGRERHFVLSTHDDRQGILPTKHWNRMKKDA